jgi:predicted glycogen debranching enzyme
MSSASSTIRAVGPPRLAIERADLPLESALTREWLEVDGLGGYASSTALGCPTRRYHGLLVAFAPGTVVRHVFLARFEEELCWPSRSFPLSMARYRGVWHPHGHQSLERFELAPWPTLVHLIGGIEVRREILAVRGGVDGRPVTLVRYSMHAAAARAGTAGEAGAAAELALRPLLACREADALTWSNLALDPRVRRSARGLQFQPYASLPPVALSLSASKHSFEADPVWFRGLEYQVDLARGYDGHEDNFSPGKIAATLAPGRPVVVAATLGEPVAEPAALFEREAARRHAAAAAVRSLPELVALRADDFLYRAPDGRLGVIAGFHWFGEWGRDTFVSLPGLTVGRSSGRAIDPARLDELGRALEGALAHLRRGLLPNVFGATPASGAYDSADAALWFARAVRLYERSGAPRDAILGRFLPALRAIAEAYLDGTALSMRVDEAGLLSAGSADANVTWMDARIDGVPVTPRHGCAVEINALWYHLLAHLEMLEHRAGDNAAARRWQLHRRRALRAFLTRFWLERERRLADGWREGRADASVRPNMVIAASLEFSPLSRGKRTDVVRCAQEELLTPRGLRTLAPDDPRYVGRYAGDQRSRDAAYHQGTVWPWLFGPYVEAWLRAYGRRRAGLEELRALLLDFAGSVATQGLGSFSEVFDGDPPHRPGGTIAQAWSVAEWLRAWRMLEVESP